VLASIGLHGQWITGYYIAENGVEPVSAIPWSKYTHVIHSALKLNADGSVYSYVTPDLDGGIVAAAHREGKKILIAISNFSSYAQATERATIATSVTNIVNFVNTNDYDGVDLDWEDSTIIASQYEDLISRLRAAMPTKVITMAVGDWGSMPIVAANQQANLDQINVMCYDQDGGDHKGSFESWYNEALLTCEPRVAAVTRAGVAASKIGGSIAFYGRRSYGCTAINQTCSSSTTIYPRDLMADSTRWRAEYQFYDSLYKANYLSIPSLNEFDSYTGSQQIADMVSWGKSNGLGGFMTAYCLHCEYLPDQTGDARYPLSTALYSAVFGGSPPPPRRFITRATLSLYISVSMLLVFALLAAWRRGNDRHKRTP